MVSSLLKWGHIFSLLWTVFQLFLWYFIVLFIQRNDFSRVVRLYCIFLTGSSSRRNWCILVLILILIFKPLAWVLKIHNSLVIVSQFNPLRRLSIKFIFSISLCLSLIFFWILWSLLIFLINFLAFKRFTLICFITEVNSHLFLRFLLFYLLF